MDHPVVKSRVAAPARRYALAASVALLAATLSAPAAQAQKGERVPSLSAMRVHLFQDKTGTLSEDVLARSDQALRNSFAGENSANAALVVVEISGPPRAAFNGYFGKSSLYRVRLTAKESGAHPAVLSDQTRTIPVLGENGKAYLGFWIVPGGCAGVSLRAVIVERPSSKALINDLNFSCGE